jgi:hypothetical protein
MIVIAVQDVCVIHDRHKGILQAMTNIKDGIQEHHKE